MNRKTIVTSLNGKRLKYVMFLSFIFLITLTAVESRFPMFLKNAYTMKDYDAFFVAGRMFWEDRLADAYYAELLRVAQNQILGSQDFMPWTYPPHFNLMTLTLGVFPIWLGYFIFTLTTLIIYVYILRKISPYFFSIVLLFNFPAILICIRTGQNGFLFSAMLGFFILGLQDGKVRSIIALSIASIKPHFLISIYLYLLMRRQCFVFFGSLVATTFILLVSTFLFGPEIWSAFLNSARESSNFLKEGYYPLYRMVSIYATLHTIGVPSRIAFIIQGALATAALGMIFWAWQKKWSRHQMLAVATMSSLFISPYAYDYDLQILGLALALLMSDLCKYSSGRQLIFILISAWLSTQSFFLSFIFGSGTIALNSLALLFICTYCLFIIRRGAASARRLSR